MRRDSNVSHPEGRSRDRRRLPDEMKAFDALPAVIRERLGRCLDLISASDVKERMDAGTSVERVLELIENTDAADREAHEAMIRELRI